MSQPMPYTGFRWLKEEEWANIDWLAQRDQQETGYIIECDMEYPPDIHNEHNDYPLAPEKFPIDYKYLSEKQVSIKRNYALSNHTGIKLVH